MKSRTLSCEKTILRKDLTRFAPIWIGFSVILAICAYEQLTANYADHAEHLPTAMFFAPILGLNLFGYLTDPKECCAVHSLPIRREGLFLTHIIGAFLMYMIPLAGYTIVIASVSEVSALLRLGFSALEFGLTLAMFLFCMFITGRKIGAALLYLFLQCLPLLFTLYVDYVYLPMLPGVYMSIERYAIGMPGIYVGTFISDLFWGKETGSVALFVILMLSATLALFGICLAMYRRRKLEHAGDLLAVQWLDPVFAVCSGLTGASVFGLLFGSSISDFNPFLFSLGLAFGYLSYWMLSKKSARVFTLRILGGLALLAAVVFGSLLLVSMDPLGRVTYVPEPEEVLSATVSEGEYSVYHYETEDPAQIAAIGSFHQQMIEEYVRNDTIGLYGNTVHVTYTLKNGRTIQRQYRIISKELREQAEWYLSQPVTYFGSDDPEITYVNARRNGENMTIPTERMEEFLEVFLEECRQGGMYSFDWNTTDPTWSLEIWVPDYRTVYITLEVDAADTIAWLENNCTKSEMIP